MKKYRDTGPYGEGDIYVLESLEDFDEYLKIDPNTSLSPTGWWNVCKNGFAKYGGKYIDDKSQLRYMFNGKGIYVRYKVIGLEVNDPWSDVYWVLENEDDQRDVKQIFGLRMLDPDIKDC